MSSKALVRIRQDQHAALAAEKSDTGVETSIGPTVEEAVDFYLKRRRYQALLMKAYRQKSIDDVRKVLDEMAEILSLPRDYLLTD